MSKRNKKWSRLDQEFLLANKDRMSTSTLAQRLDRTESSIASKIQDLKKLSYPNNKMAWSPADIKYLYDHIDQKNEITCSVLKCGPKEVDKMRFAIKQGSVKPAGVVNHVAELERVRKEVRNMPNVKMQEFICDKAGLGRIQQNYEYASANELRDALKNSKYSCVRSITSTTDRGNTKYVAVGYIEPKTVRVKMNRMKLSVLPVKVQATNNSKPEYLVVPMKNGFSDEVVLKENLEMFVTANAQAIDTNRHIMRIKSWSLEPVGRVISAGVSVKIY